MSLVHIDGQASLSMKIGFLIQDCVKSRTAVNPGFSSLNKLFYIASGRRFEETEGGETSWDWIF